MSLSAEKRYLNKRTDMIIENKLLADADVVPTRIRKWKTFQEEFGNVNHYEFIFMDLKIIVDVRYAFSHFQKNTYSESRSNITGTILPVLHDPLIVIKMFDRDKKVNVLTFYKPFRNENKVIHLLMFHAYEVEPKVYRFKTIFEASTLYKVKNVIKMPDGNTLYFKYKKE